MHIAMRKPIIALRAMQRTQHASNLEAVCWNMQIKNHPAIRTRQGNEPTKLKENELHPSK